MPVGCAVWWLCGDKHTGLDEGKGVRKRTHAKPVRAHADEWVELELTPLENFLDDMRRYGLLTALRNVIVPWFVGEPETDEEEETGQAAYHAGYTGTGPRGPDGEETEAQEDQEVCDDMPTPRT